MEDLFSRKFKELERYLPNAARRFSCPPEMIEEIVQDTWVKAWRFRNSFDQKSSFSTWITTILRNNIFDLMRRRKLANFDGEILTEVQDNSDKYHWMDDQRIMEEFEDPIKRCLSRMPERRRRIFLERTLYGMSYRKLSELHSQSNRSVQSHMRKATESLKRATSLRKKEEELGVT